MRLGADRVDQPVPTECPVEAGQSMDPTDPRGGPKPSQALMITDSQLARREVTGQPVTPHGWTLRNDGHRRVPASKGARFSLVGRTTAFASDASRSDKVSHPVACGVRLLAQCVVPILPTVEDPHDVDDELPPGLSDLIGDKSSFRKVVVRIPGRMSSRARPARGNSRIPSMCSRTAET